MKSVTIKNLAGEKLIKISHTKKGYFCEFRNDHPPFDCLIVADGKERITIPARNKA